ncbi:MAG: ABC transporter substrate-binding protein [Brevundimonas sp.]|uniref:ABC transporter substrate-binding protein n=1 Tax=Brevundimonas sp. TaxID=1871086 RepID=UPI00391933FF
MSFVSRPIPRRGLLAGAAAFGLLAGCGRGQAPVDAQGRVRLRLALDAEPGLAQAGVFQALATDLYARRRLSIERLPDATPLGERLGASNAELALAADAVAILDLAAQRAPVRAVAAFLQKSPLALIARGQPGPDLISTLRDRPILVSPSDAPLAWPWLRARFGLVETQRQAATTDAFFDEPGAVLLADVLTAPQAVLQTRPQIQLLADQGYPAYGGVLAVPDAFARDNVRALRDFVAETVEGWRDYLQDDPDAAHALMRQADPSLTEPVQMAARSRMRDLALVEGGDAALVGLGAMTAERWQAVSEAAVQAGLFSAAPPPRALFTDDYLPGRG